MTPMLSHQKVIVAVSLAVSLAVRVAAANLPDTLRGFQPRSLEVYLDRADQERTATDWQRVARFGAEASVAQWEQGAAQLYADAAEMAAAHTELTNWVGGQMQERYESWLIRRFFDEQGSLGISAVRQAISDANLQYLYTTDSSGAVQFDDNGDPVLRGEDGLPADKEGWKAKVGQAEEAILAAWEKNVDQAFAPELGSLLEEEGLSRYQDYKVGMEDGLRREMEHVCLQGEISLISRRLYDQYSLRKNSESATADAIADEIVRVTKTQTDAGIQQIQAGLSLTPESVDSSTPTIDVEKWQESFKAVFEAGLSRWDDAEQEFLANRMEWEQDAGTSYTEGEQAWAAAFQRLQAERKSWEKQVDTLLQAGAARWDEQRTDLAAAIDDARSEFQKERDQRVSGMQDQVGALVDMYAQSQQVLATAQASGQALIKRIGITDTVSGDYVKFDPASVEVIEGDRKDRWADCVADIKSVVDSLNIQISGLAARIASLGRDLEEPAGFFSACGVNVSITGPNTIRATSSTSGSFGTATTTTTILNTSINSATCTVTTTYASTDPRTGQIVIDTTTTSMRADALLVDQMRKYLQYRTEQVQDQGSLQDVRDQVAPLQSLYNVMNAAAAKAGSFAQGEAPEFLEARRQYQEYLKQQSPFDADIFAVEWERYGRLKDWLDILNTYNDQADATQQKLKDALGATFGAEATDLRDVLKTGGDSAVAYLDEYQLELLRANAVQDYWTQKKAIADAVVAYAQDLSSGRQTEDQSQKAYDAAQQNYTARLDAYNQVMTQLKAGGADLAAARQALETAQQAADDASTQYETARNNYMQALVATQSGNVEFYQDQIKQRYSELLAASGMTESDRELNDASTAYFAAARRYGYDLAAQDAWGSVSVLVHGDPESGMPSLESLKNLAGAIQVPDTVDSIPGTVEQLGVPFDSAQFSPVSALYSSWHDEAPGVVRDLAGWKLVGAMKILKANAQAAYDERLAEIKAHGAVDADSWYSECGGRRIGSSLAARMSSDSTAAQLALIAARAEAEEGGLAAWLQLQDGQATSDSNAAMLAHAAPSGLSRNEANARIQALLGLQNALQGFDTDPAAAVARLREQVEDGGWIQSFVAGNGSFLDERAGDLVLPLCMPQFAEAARAEGLLSAWSNASWDSTALVAERESSAIEDIKRVFAARGLQVVSGSALPTSESIAARLDPQNAVDAVAFAANLSVELSQASSTGPQWLQDRMSDYADSLAGYLIALASKGGVTLASEQAASAATAAQAAKAAQGDLKSVSAQLSGTGRIAALVDVSTRGIPPSASAVSAQSLIVESAAIQAAMRSLADTGQTLAQIAATLVPGLSGAISDQIVQRASQLLQTNSGSGVSGQRIAAYRQWNAFDVDEAVTGITVNPLASQAKTLWDLLEAAGGNDSQPIDTYLAQGTAPREIVDFCQALESSIGSREELFRTFLFGKDFDSLIASFAGLGAAGEVYQRAVVLRIASLQEESADGQALAGFLRDRTGIRNAQDAASFAGQAASLDLVRAAFAGASELSLEYLCKSLLLQDFSITGDLSDRLSAAPQPVRDEVSAFEEKLRAERGYIPVLDGSPGQYIAGLGGDLSMQSSLAAALAMGQWDDELFAAASDRSYLEWRQGVVETSLDSAVQVIQGELAQTSSDYARTSYQRSMESGYWKRVTAQMESPASWRQYLTGSNVGDESPVASAVLAQTRDSGSYAKATVTEPDANELLESFNELANQEPAFRQQLGADSGNRQALTKFHDFLAQLLSGAAEETDLPAVTEQGLAAAQDSYRAALSRIEGLKEDIRRSGAALDLLDFGTADRQSMLAELKAATDGLSAQVSSTQAAADAALGEFEAIGTNYNARYAQLQTSEEQLADARFALRMQQEIKDWASSGYLSSSGETVQGYQSPLQNQEAAEQHLVKATAALDALQGLFGSATVSERAINDPAAQAAYEAWKSSYAEMMRLERISGELNAATAEQQDKVQELTTRLDTARNDILDGSRALAGISDYLDGDGNPDASRLTSWNSYLVVQDGKLKLNVDRAFGLVAQTGVDDVENVRDFFQASSKQADGSEATGFEQQMGWFVGYVQSKSGQLSGLINRWGFAADWLKRRLYDSGSQNGSQAVKDLVGSAYQSNTALIGDPKWLDFRAAGERNDQVSTTWADQAYGIAGTCYGQVMADPEEKAAFEFYLAMRAATGREGADLSQFHTQTYAWIMTQLSGLIAQRYGHFQRLASDHGWFNGLTGSKQDRDEYYDLLIECNNTIAQFQSDFDSNALGSGGSAFRDAQVALAAGKARLAELKGTNGSPLASFTDFIAQYREMEGERKGTTQDAVQVDPDLNAQLSKAWDVLKPEDKVSFSAALEKMTQLAEGLNADTEIDVRAALAKARSDSAQAQADYRSAYNAFLEGQVDAPALEDAAAKAYRSSAWVARTEQELTAGVLSQAAFTTGPLTNVEMQARMTAVQRYAQSIVTAYAGSLDARGAAAEQEWNQSMTDLGDQRQTWYAQVGLVRAKAASAWDASQQKLASSISAWRQGFQQQYAQCSDAWRFSYLNFGEQKLQWVQQVGTKAARAGNEAILSEVGASADDAMRSASTPMIASLSFDPKEATLQVEGLLSQVGSDEALASIRRVNAGISESQVMVASVRLGVDTLGAKIAAEVKRFLLDSRAELATMAAREIADEAQQSVEEAKKALAKSVNNANEGFSQNMTYTFANAGYATSSSGYQREAIVRTTFSDVITEQQKVEGYRPYAMPVIHIAVDLGQGRLSGLQAEAVMDLVGVAQQDVASAQKKVFGEGKDLSDEQKRNQGLMLDFSANGKSVTKEFGEGEFGRYIGYAPEFTDEPDFDHSRDRNIVVKGTGELGRLMGDFIWNQMKEGRGWSEMALPRWDKPLWDDSGSWFKAPSLRTVGTIASGLAATIMIPGGGIVAMLGSAAVSTASTAVFDTMDVAYGYKTWEEAGLDVGKTFLSSAVTSAVGGVFNGFDPGKAGGIAGLTGSLGKGAVSKAMLAGAQALTTNVATSAINSINLNGGWGVGFDTEAFKEGAFGKNAWASVAGAAGAAAATATLASWNTRDGNAIALSRNVFNTKSLQNFNNLTGGLTSSAIQYGITGEATFNVMRLSGNIDGREWGSGLMEMHVGGDFSMNLGTSGTDISYGTIGASMSGLYDTAKITGARASAALGDVRGSSTLNAINMLGYTTAEGNHTLARDIWLGAKKVSYYDGSTAGISEQDLKALGYAESTDTIGINARMLGSGKESAAQIASLVVHEGVHLGGNEEMEAKMGGTSAYADLIQPFGVTGSGYEDTGIAWSAGMLQKYGPGAFGFIASAQIASEGTAYGPRQYELAAETDPVKLAKASLEDALKNTNGESDKLWNYVVNSPDPFALLGANDKFSSFTAGVLSSENYGDAFALLNGLKEALKDSKDSVAGTMYSHDVLQYTTKVFTGTTGYDGLSGALFMANMASGQGSERMDKAFGYLINDVSQTYTGEYLNINYDRSGSEQGGTSGATYWSNSSTVEPKYGAAVTGWFPKGNGYAWQDTNGNVPSLDCVGYVDLVAYAAGALKAGQAYTNSTTDHKRALDSSSKDYTNARDARLLGSTGSMQNSLLANWGYGLAESWADRVTAGTNSGVYLTSYDTRVDPVAAPQVGDLVFLGPPGDQHIGFYGIDDHGQNILIHSAPSTVIGHETYEAGPRTNTLVDWNSTRANDSYSNWLVANGYFTGWTDQFNGGGTNFGRIKPWWNTSLLGRR